MNYPRVVVPHDQFAIGKRVYVKDLDVFGRVRMRNAEWVVLCESPMTNYVYEIKEGSVLYNEAIGDRDPED
jgi:hypothetical protein